MRRAVPFLVAALALAASSSRAAETRISINETARQRVPVALLDGHGAARVVWENTKLGILTRLVPVDEAGAGATAEWLLARNTHVPSVPGEGVVITHREPALVSDGDGGFWAFWTRERAYLEVVPFYERRDVLSQEIRRRHFDRHGEPTDEATIVARSAAFQAQPTAIRTADGGIAVAWWSDDRDKRAAGDDGVFARLFDAAGEPRGAAFQVSPLDHGELANRPALASDHLGRLLILWQGPDGNSTGIFRRLFDADGVALGAAKRLNTITAGMQSQPSAIAVDGGYLVLWQGAIGVRKKTQVFLTQLDAAGGALGNERIISSGPLEYEMGPVAVRTGHGTYFAAWVSWDSSFPRALRGIELEADGSTIGEERNLSTLRLGAVYRPSLARSQNDGVFAVWEAFPVKHKPGAILGRLLEFLD